MFSGRTIKAEEALRMGLADRVVDEATRGTRRGDGSGGAVRRRAAGVDHGAGQTSHRLGLEGSLEAGLELEQRLFA